MKRYDIIISGGGMIGSITAVAAVQAGFSALLIEANKSDWINQFPNQSLIKTNEESFKVKRDGGEFDQFTGATITPRAIVKAVYNTLRYYKKNRDSLYE